MLTESTVENARDITKKSNIPLTIGHYLKSIPVLTNQWNSRNYKHPALQRIYLKDIDCPQLWHDKLTEILPPGVFYLNETTGDIGGFGAVDEIAPTRPGTRKGRGIAKAGDLMSSLPKEMRAENMMCYIGHEGTYTPAHREMCASLGQNIMVEASTGAVEDGKLTKPGSSIWFMTEKNQRQVVSEYWLSRLGHDIEIENHFAQINAWKNAPFKTYVVEQKPGDFILIPPLAPHQVWNRGTRTMKVAWNRTTIETLEMALHEALPQARMVCRDEQYKNKAIIYYSLQKYSKLLRAAEKIRNKTVGSKHKPALDPKVRQLEKDFRRLHILFTEMLVSESFSPDRPQEKTEKVPYEGVVTCSYCRCNIFNRFLTCPSCLELPNGEEDAYDICLECYAMGRSCACISKLRWVEQWSWQELTQKHEQWRLQILQYQGEVTERSPRSLKTELSQLGQKRTLAQICQLELARRPFYDIRRPPSPAAVGDHDEEADKDTTARKKKKPVKSEKFIREHARCHVDFHWEPKWKQAACSKCDKNYCYGNLFRAYDMKPQDILADPAWQCPSCRNICGCRTCRKRPGYQAYVPFATVLGHDTKAVADSRSVESLVDFSYSNIGWIQKAGGDGEHDTHRLNSRLKEANAATAKDLELGDNYVDDGDELPDRIDNAVLRLAEHEGIPIDPALAMDAVPSMSQGSPDDEDQFDENPEGAKPTTISTPMNAPPLQYAVPEGGVIRDIQHAYDPTEAITYDYPDPEPNIHVPVPTDEQTTTLPPGYADAAPEDTGAIEMVPHKRKRTKTDEGDRPDGHKKAVTEKSKKKRKSLIVGLPINPEKLVAMSKMVDMARQALVGVDVPAPVITSDIQALNAVEGGSQQAPKRKRGADQPVVESDDDDFTPGRYRDRRKVAANGASRPARDSDITRRQTRMLNVHYEEPSEEDFNEMVAEPARRINQSNKVVRLDDADPLDDDSPAVDDFSSENEDFASMSAVGIRPDPALQKGLPVLGTASAQHAKGVVNRDLLAGQHRRSVSTASESQSRGVQPAPKLLNKSSSKSQHRDEALANQRAKMAAVEWMENDSDSLDAWSENSVLSDRPAAPEPVAATKSRPLSSSSSSASSEHRSPFESASTAARKQTMPVSATLARKQTMPLASDVVRKQTKPLTSTVGRKQTKPAQIPAQTAVAKVSAAAWGDSDDSDDEPPARKPAGNAWVSINSAASTRPPLMKSATEPKKRGRPPKHMSK